MGRALCVLSGLLALLAIARPSAGRISAGAPAAALELDEFSTAALSELSTLTEPWESASGAPAPAHGLSTINNTTSLQAADPEAAKAKPLRGVGLYGPNIPNELQVFSQNSLTWYYTWECAPARMHCCLWYNPLCTCHSFTPCSHGTTIGKALYAFAARAVCTLTLRRSSSPDCTARSLCP